MTEWPKWDEDQLRAVALAYRTAQKRGLPNEAFGASLKVVAHCFPEAQNHKVITAAMLLEASGKWGSWLLGDDSDGPDGSSNDKASPS